MYDQTLRLKLLPPELIVKGFINGEKNCNYESYLLELVNQSAYFLELSQGRQYCAPERESHGECDCISESYQLDFKLIGGKTPLQARRLLSNQKSLVAEGVVAIGPPKEKGGSIDATIMSKALRGYSFSQLCELREKNPKEQGIENDVCQLLKTLEKKKNLLLFLPFAFGFDSEYRLKDGGEQIATALYSDFCHSMDYRNHVVTGFDTFICFIYSEHLIVLKTQAGQFRIVDYICLKNSPIYMKLKGYAECF